MWPLSVMLKEKSRGENNPLILGSEADAVDG